VVDSGRPFVRSAQSGVPVLGQIDRSPAVCCAPKVLGMDIDAALIAISFVSFAVLLVSWIVSPLRAAAATEMPIVEATPPGAAVAA
jgi:hypothetical protein